MGGSTADTPTTPEFLRVSDADRDHALSELRNEFVEGRLSHETFMYRMQSALGARHRNQLTDLFTDLPPRRPGLLDRIRTALGGTARSEGAPGIVPTQRMRQAPVSPGHAPIPWARGNWEEPESGAGAGEPAETGSGRIPAPLAFPPGGGTRFVIGRTSECDLCLADLSVSRRHAELIRVQDGWLLTDLGSHNGTRLNGWLVREPVPVRAGDRVEFGAAMFVFADNAPPASSVPL
jgi:hypothetical protein